MSPLLSLIVALLIGLAVGFFYDSLEQTTTLLTVSAFAAAALAGALVAILIGNTGRNAAAGSTAAPRKKSAGSRQQGTVKWFNYTKGFGFITRDNGEDIFVHFKSIRGEGDGKRGLREGQRVEFSVSVGDKGEQADDVTVIPR